MNPVFIHQASKLLNDPPEFEDDGSTGHGMSYALLLGVVTGIVVGIVTIVLS